VFGLDHPTVAIVLNNLATLYYDMGDIALATILSGRAAVIQENNISRSLLAGSEQDKQDYIQENLTNLDFGVSLSLQSHSTKTHEFASTNVLNRQGRVLDETAQLIQIIRSQLKNRPDLRQQLDDWSINFQEQSDLASSNFSQKNIEGYRDRYNELKQK
jgi:predicted O-linked N-acetylglucosamine transferase (SPINDLY family)